MPAQSRIPALCIVLCLFCGLAVYAGGQNDPVLSRADQLVKQKQFNEALRLLSDFIKEDDIRFDAAQERIRKILRNNEYYHQLVNRLVDVYEKNPDDYETIVAIADDLRRIDAPHDENLRRFVARIQELARFTVNRDLIERILREGRALIEAGDYVAAVQKYQSGFAIFETELWASRFDPAILEETRQTMNLLSSAVENVAKAAAPVAAARTAAQLTSRDQTAANQRALNSAAAVAIPYLETLVEAKTAFARAEQFFETTGAQPQIERSGNMGRFFFPASALFLRGRVNDSLREGMLGAVDALWKSAAIPLSGAYEGVSERLYLAALNAAERGDTREGAARVSAAKEFIMPLAALSKQVDPFLAADAGSRVARDDQQSVAALAGNILRFGAMDNALSYFSSALTIGARFEILKTEQQKAHIWESWQSGQLSAEAAINEMRELREEFNGLNSAVQAEIAAIDRESAALNQRSGPVQSLPSSSSDETPLAAGLRYYGDSRRVMEALDGNVHGALIAATEQIYGVANENIKNRIAGLEKQYEEGQRLMTGVETKTEQGQDIIAKYSREAAGTFDGMKDDLLSGLEMGALLLDEYRQDTTRARELTAQITQLESETSEYTRRLRELEAIEARDNQLARERAGRAENLRLEGERRLAESRRALGERDFELARSSIETASSRWHESLELQENPVIRRAWLSELDPLAKEIARLEYEATLKEVRALLDSSRERYFGGNFERAEEALMRAESRWIRVSPDPHDEIVYWLGLVRAALSIRSGSTVPVTAPLYPDFSQLLSEAMKNYREGVEFFREDRRDLGIVRLSLAKEATREIKLLFPVNQDAGILELRIDKVIDPSAFEDVFRQKFAAAVDGARRQQRESYLELENLAQINPRYPGIQTALTEAKYNVGLLIRPADTSTERRSTTLLTQAQQLFGRGNRTQTAEVMRLANEALRLNPNNRQAALFLDRVRLSTGTVAAIVAADPTAEQDYLTAVREFQQGNTLIAMSIMQRLLQHPANRNNTRFQELQRRIAAAL